MSAPLGRLRSMSRDEIAFRTRVAVRAQMDRLSCAARAPRWKRADVGRALAAYVRDDAMTQDIGRRDWAAVHRRLAQVLVERPSRFPIDPAGAPEFRAGLLRRWPAAADQARARAERIVGGEYDLLGYERLRVSRDGAVDWHFDPVNGRRAARVFWADVPFLDPSIGDHKVIWELNRHQQLLALGRALWLTGDDRYGREIVAQLQSWLAANPPLIGINWASMLELAFRSLSWVSALHLLLGARTRQPQAPREVAHDTCECGGGDATTDEAWLVDMFVGLHHQMGHMARNLSYYFSPNTHLLGEALALYVVGQSLPELASSARWTDLGRRILLEQIDRQIEPDGGHAERSLHYHRYTHDFYLLALLMAERCGDDEASARFREAAGRLATFLREVADDNGRIALVGDDDGGMLWPMTGRDSADVRDSLALSAVLLGRPELAPWGLCEETMWLAWSTSRDRLPQWDPIPRPAPVTRVTVFPSTGYVAARDGEGGHLLFDAGPHGFLNGGHAHADALAVTLSVSGRPLLIDPGTGSYTANVALRDRLRRTANHNTLTIGGRSSSIPAGPFQWRTKTDARLGGVIGNPRFGWMEASHDGYPGLRHRRTIVQAGGGWLIVDEVLGEAGTETETHWHFDPRWRVACASDQAIAARHPDGLTAWIVHDACSTSLEYGNEESGFGWCSPRYGALVPTWSARLSRTMAGPASMLTWIGAAADGEAAPSLERLGTTDGAEGAIAVRLRRHRGASVTVIRAADGASRGGMAIDDGEFDTDARLLHYTIGHDGAVRSLALAAGTRATAGRGLLSIVADRPVDDIHLEFLDGCLDVRASVPPPQLRLDGLTLDPAAAVRLNGHLASPRRGSSRSTLVITGADWPGEQARPGVDLCVA